jgi:hypothetical protein
MKQAVAREHLLWRSSSDYCWEVDRYDFNRAVDLIIVTSDILLE